MLRFLSACLCTIALLYAGIIPSSAEPIYQPIPTGAQWGFTEVYDPTQGIEYGKARIDYWYWHDQATNYWHYSYQISNNDYLNTPSNLDDDYHFGWLRVEGSSPTTYDTINKFSIDLDPDNDNFGPPDLAILDTQAGSSAGGGSWGGSPDPGNIGVDWTVSLGSGTPLPIAPTRHEWKRISGKWQWVLYADGQTSRNDATGQYFHIASKWQPGLTTAAITAYVDRQAAGYVMAPVVPEPSSLISLLTASSLGGLAILRRRRMHK